MRNFVTSGFNSKSTKITLIQQIFMYLPRNGKHSSLRFQKRMVTLKKRVQLRQLCLRLSLTSSSLLKKQQRILLLQLAMKPKNKSKKKTGRRSLASVVKLRSSKKIMKESPMKYLTSLPVSQLTEVTRASRRLVHHLVQSVQQQSRLQTCLSVQSIVSAMRRK